MILGGLAVALGVVIDDAVIGTENILRRLRERTHVPAKDVIVAAAVEVRAPVVYATFVLALTMAPVLFLIGPAGRVLLAARGWRSCSRPSLRCWWRSR